jgi:pimeloyl-ACP methyl ester carboxylesterase
VPARTASLDAAPGVSLHYEIRGHGSRWLIVPGGRITGDLSALFDTHRVVGYDPRGRGKSTAVSETLSIGLEEDLADLDALRRHLGVERASLLGISYFGGLVALYASRHAGHVDRVVMLGPIAPTARQFAERADGGEAPVESEADRRVRQLREGGVDTVDPVRFCRASQLATAEDLFCDPARIRVDPSLCELPNERPAGVAAWATRLFSALGDWDFRPDAARVRAPILVVQGAADRITPPAGGRAWVAAAPEARLLWLPDTGHVPWRERPETVIPAVEDFLLGSAPGEELQR